MKDFLESKPIWIQILDATGHDSFKPEEYCANGYLWVLKTLDVRSVKSLHACTIFTLCLEFALRLEAKYGRTQIQYLDEVGRVGMDLRRRYLETEGKDIFRPLNSCTDIASFVDVAATFNLVGYIGIKAETMTQEELDHVWKCANPITPPRWVEFVEEDHKGQRTALVHASNQSCSEMEHILTSPLLARVVQRVQKKISSKSKRLLQHCHISHQRKALSIPGAWTPTEGKAGVSGDDESAHFKPVADKTAKKTLQLR